MTLTSGLISRFSCFITANFPQMCLMLDQFLWGHSSRVCDISCSFRYKAPSLETNLEFVASFLDFLVGSEDWGRRLELTANDIQISKVGIKGVATSLKEDEQREIVER